ncbi:hypothetical protein ACFLJF_005875 [Salmonella enterica]
MALSNAEKQKRYRNNKRLRGDLGDIRINTFVTFRAGHGLDMLSKYYGLTKRQVLELLIEIANQKLIDSLEIDSPEWVKYFGDEEE